MSVGGIGAVFHPVSNEVMEEDCTISPPGAPELLEYNPIEMGFAYAQLSLQLMLARVAFSGAVKAITHNPPPVP